MSIRCIHCSKVVGHSPCESCRLKRQRQRDASRGTRQERGYTNDYMKLRKAILAANNVCHLCGKYATTVDHVIPLSRGGTNTPGNLLPCCLKCNSSKGARE